MFGCRGNSDVQSCSHIHVAEMSRCAAVSPGLGKLQDALKYWERRGKLPTSCLLFCTYYYLTVLLCASVRLPFRKQTSQRWLSIPQGWDSSPQTFGVNFLLLGKGVPASSLEEAVLIISSCAFCLDQFHKVMKKCKFESFPRQQHWSEI